MSTAIAPEFNARTSRYQRLARLLAYTDSTQYAGRPDWWTGGSKRVPLRERAPCIIYPLPKNAALEAVRFTFGEGRFPKIVVRAEEADTAVGGFGLSKDDAEALQRGVADIIEQAQLKVGLRTLLLGGLTACTAVAILSVRDGRLCADYARALDCIPTFKRPGDPTSPVVALTWTYQYASERPDERTGEPTSVQCYFRRDITATEVVDYEPAEVVQGQRPTWRESLREAHGFSFCPVVWIRNLPNEHRGDIDGTSLLDGLFEEFDSLNLALSQRHRGIMFFGVPQPWETGVDEDDGPAATGRTASTPGWSAAPAGANAPPGAVGAGGVCAVPSGGDAARKVGPDAIWSYQGENVKVGLVETTGAAFKVATDHVDDISARLKQSMGVVLANAVDTLGKGDMSAKFLALVYAPLLALVDDLRECWWGAGLQPIVQMFLRIIAELDGKGLLLRNANGIAALLKGRTMVTEAGPMWLPPPMSPVWGPYFSASDDEVGKAVDATEKAITAKLIPRRAGVTYLANHFGIEDVDEALEEIDEEAQAADAAHSEGFHAAMTRLAAKTDDGDGADTEDAAEGNDTEDEPAPASERAEA
jgi:hypothetical protein